MKVIDLLNKIANREIEDETIFKVNGDFFYYLIVNDENLYVINTMTNQLEKLDSKYIGRFIKYQYDLVELKYISNKLNDEVEIIEEDKKIKKIPKKDKNGDIYLYSNEALEIIDKINEIIDYLDKE